jgi:hypothetical protein
MKSGRFAAHSKKGAPIAKKPPPIAGDARAFPG